LLQLNVHRPHITPAIMHARLLLVLVFFAVAVTGFPQPLTRSLGDRLLRTFLLFKNQPLTMQAARSQGWAAMNGSVCGTAGIGYSTNYDGEPSKLNPTILYYSAGGQISGFGVRVWGSTLSSYLIDQGMLLPTGNDDNSYDIFLTTRDTQSICSGNSYAEVVGDRLSLAGFFPIPLDQFSAKAAGWVMGNCIGRMGMHHAYDLAAPGQQTWNATTLVPILPMYDAQNHTINAILINAPDFQITEPVGVFEGPFINTLFCLNWCHNSGCHWPGVTVWTTLHWHFVDPSTISCSSAPCSL